MIFYYLIKFNNNSFQLISTFYYDNQLYTQGLEIINDKLVISSGLYGKSKICEYDLNEQKVEVKQLLDKNYFGEGITFNDKNIVQLTWQEEKIIILNKDSYKVEDIKDIHGEGWGICFNDNKYYISNGSEYICIYDNSFQELYKIKILYKDQPIFRINELEFYKGYIYANQLDTCNIYKINPSNGNVSKKYDLSKNDEISQLNKSKGSMNGIAKYKDNMFYITGKNWDKMFLVKLD